MSLFVYIFTSLLIAATFVRAHGLVYVIPLNFTFSHE